MEDKENQNGSKSYKRKRIFCPHCGEEMLLMVKWEADAIVPPEVEGDQEARTAEGYWRGTQSAEVLKELDALAPMITTFTKVWGQVHGVEPRIPAKAFLAWSRVLQVVAMPPEVSMFFMRQYPSETIRALFCNKVAVILVNEVLTHIIPLNMLVGNKIKGVSLRAMTVETESIANWIRTKYGYVAGPGLMLGQLRQRCFGAFDKPGVTSN